MVKLSLQDLEAVVESLPPFKGVKGSVVRLKIHDFMTYHKVEMKAGPNVNLILGPNGTGKSTIVCALCIGLAGKAKILGRAGALKEYIRHGCKAASIEIELYNPDGTNYIIKRSIKESGNGAVSQWYLNGSKVQPAAVEKLLSSLNIQLDNLCQFLPQDRVQEFTTMDACALLKSTQQAMGRDTLISKHDRLIELNDMVKLTDHTLKNNSELLRAEQQYIQRQENEVKNYHDREKFKSKIAEFKGKKAWIVYLKAVKLFSALNSELETLKAKKKEEEQKLAPMKKSVQAMESKHIKYRQEMNNCRNQTGSLINAVKRKYEDDCDGIEVKVNEINSELAAQERSEKERQKRVQGCTQKIVALEKDLEELRARGDLDEAKLSCDIKALESKITKLSEKIFEIAGMNEADEFEKRDLLAKIRQSEAELRRLDDLRISRMKFLQREHGDLYRGVEHFAKPENRANLKGRIHEPMILHLCVNDLKYGSIVERFIGISDMTAYFCEDREDVEEVLNVCKRLNLRFSVIHHQCPPGFVKPGSSYSNEFLRKYHFQKVLVDLIEAPEYYLSYICKKKPQSVPIGDAKTNEIFHIITEQTDVRAFYTNDSAYYVKPSSYGPEKCTSVTFLNPARIFTSQINATERERLQAYVETAKGDCVRIEKQIKQREPQCTKLEQERKEAEDEVKDIRSRMEYRRILENKLIGAKRSKEMLERDVPDLENMRDKANVDIWKQRVHMVDFVEWAVTEIEKNAKRGEKLIILKRQVSVLQSRIITKQTLLEELESNINQNNGQIKLLTDQVQSKAAEAERNKKEALNVSQLTEAPADVATAKITEEEIDKEINLATVQLGFLVDTDASIVKDYEQRLKKIDQLNRKRVGEEEKLAKLKQEIVSTKTEWLEPLKDLISRINDNFGRFFQSMDCAGQVLLYTGDDENDFAKYGIKIMVKFRSSEPLSEMGGAKSGTLQSGGERAITTALYILALQELTVVPFRVIDEINQGMDIRNEARFFNLLCSMAKGNNTPQYFLLTPKMLPAGVDYPDNVEFHFIMNGPKVHVPLDSDWEDDSDEDEDDEVEGNSEPSE